MKAIDPRTLRRLQQRPPLQMLPGADPLEVAAAAAARARAEIERQAKVGAVWCERCNRYHPPVYRWRGRDRDWHHQPDANLSEGQRKARARAEL